MNVAPFTFDLGEHQLDDDEDFDTREGLRMMGIAFTPTNEEASYCAIIDGDGEVTDYIKLEFFMLKRTEGFATDKDRSLRAKDREKLKRCFLSH